MPGDLGGVRQKLKRAQTHLDELTARLDNAEGRGGLYGLACEPDTKAGQYVIKVKKMGDDSEWPLILGDFLHNLQAALDHLVWQLVLANGETPDSGNEFGIFLKPALFDASQHGQRDLRGVHPEARAAIRRVQPFCDQGERPDALHPLWLLRQLEIVDKHHLVHTVALVPEALTLTFTEDFAASSVELMDLSGGVVEDGTHVAVVTADAQPKVQMNSALSLLVLIQQTALTPALEWGVLDAMRDNVDRVVRALTPFVVWPPS